MGERKGGPPGGMPRWLLYALALVYLAAAALLAGVLVGAVAEWLKR